MRTGASHHGRRAGTLPGVVVEVAVFEINAGDEDAFAAAYHAGARRGRRHAGLPVGPADPRGGVAQPVRAAGGVGVGGRAPGRLPRHRAVHPLAGRASGRTSPRRRRSSTTPTSAHRLVRLANVAGCSPPTSPCSACPAPPRSPRTAGAPCVTVTRLDLDADEYRSRLWLVDTTGDEPPRPLTDGPRDSAPAWSPDGRWIAFLRAGRSDRRQAAAARCCRPTSATPAG